MCGPEMLPEERGRGQDTARTDKLQLGEESNPALLALWRQFQPLGHTTPGFNEVLDHSADSSPFITFHSLKPACVFSLVLFSLCGCSQFGWNHSLWQCRAAEKEEVEKGDSLSVCVRACVCGEAKRGVARLPGVPKLLSLPTFFWLVIHPHWTHSSTDEARGGSAVSHFKKPSATDQAAPSAALAFHPPSSAGPPFFSSPSPRLDV